MANTYLKYGDTGDSVLAMQKQINQWGANQSGYTPLQEDGIFGNKTNDALRKFQQSSGITVDGLYGNETSGAFANMVGTGQSTGNVPALPMQSGGNQTLPQQNAPTAPQSPYNWTFNYDASQDKAFQDAASLNKSMIAQEMAARGIGGSTIEQERIAQAIAGLNLDYRAQAYNQFSNDRNAAIQKAQDEYTKERNYKQDELTRVETMLNGVFDNQAALAWGVPPGTTTTSRLGRDAQKVQQDYDNYITEQSMRYKAQEAADKKLQASTDKSFSNAKSVFMTNFKNDPEKAIDIVKNLGLSEDQLIEIFDNTPLDDNGLSPWDYLNPTPTREKGRAKAVMNAGLNLMNR